MAGVHCSSGAIWPQREWKDRSLLDAETQQTNYREECSAVIEALKAYCKHLKRGRRNSGTGPSPTGFISLSFDKDISVSILYKIFSVFISSQILLFLWSAQRKRTQAGQIVWICAECLFSIVSQLATRRNHLSWTYVSNCNWPHSEFLVLTKTEKDFGDKICVLVHIVI